MNFNRILVTGSEGFVGRHLMSALGSAFPAAEIIGSSRSPEHGELLEITDGEQTCEALSRLQPDVCVHLAGIAAIGTARSNPRQAWDVNLHGTLNVANAILMAAPQCRLIFISSAECYGASFKAGVPLSEDANLAPMNLYAATKSATELALGVLAGEGLRLLRLRPFNHTGPGQNEEFVVPAFAGQIARIEAGLVEPEMAVGALTPERDFLDIRDVCSAYVASIQKFDCLPNNQVINIASGMTMRIGAILDILLANATRPIAVRQDPSRMRPVEIIRALGDASRARALLDWQPRFALEDTLKAVLNFARQQTSLGSVSSG
jgi:GDP-4-dehydro-6-deoxy-D-mannose reductase